jgi:ribonuclease HI
MPKKRYYVVWKGRKRGIFNSWEECEAQVKGYVDAQYKAFDSRAEAEHAFTRPYTEYKGKPSSTQRWLFSPEKPILPSITVDAACSGSPGPVEFRGVETETGTQIFRDGPFSSGTNNVGEFLAIAQAVIWLEERHLDWPIYSDSENAIGWVKAGKCRTKLVHMKTNERLFNFIARAEAYLGSSNTAVARKPRILKWDTLAWGENPADFGRK